MHLPAPGPFNSKRFRSFFIMSGACGIFVLAPAGWFGKFCRPVRARYAGHLIHSTTPNADARFIPHDITVLFDPETVLGAQCAKFVRSDESSRSSFCIYLCEPRA